MTSTPAGDPYPVGITYTAGAGHGIDVSLDPGVGVVSAGQGVVATAATNYDASVYTSYGDSITSAFRGVAAQASGTGNAYIVNNASVSSGAKGLQAFAGGSGNVSIINTGDLNVHATATYAAGIVLGNAGGAGYLNNSGNITVSGITSGFGIYSTVSGAAVLITSGNISATGVTVAVGIGDNASSTSVFLDNSGSIYAHATGATGAAVGINLNASGNLNVYNYGAITAVGNTAYGVYLNSTTGASDLTQTGDISASSGSGVAVGVYQRGYSTLTHVTGNVTATSTAGGAAGIDVASSNLSTAYVREYGDVTAVGYAGATGVTATGGITSTFVHGSVARLFRRWPGQRRRFPSARPVRTSSMLRAM